MVAVLSEKTLTLAVLPGGYAICQLPPRDAVPQWALRGGAGFGSVTRTPAELSVICPAGDVPAGVAAETGWRCLRIDETFPVDEPGVVASVVGPLAAAGLSVFAVASFDTDHLLVTDVPAAVRALTAAGHRVVGAVGS